MHLMNENHSYNSKAYKNKGAGTLMRNFACKYYFLIAILNGEPRRFEPGPSEGKQANPVESSFTIYYCSCQPQWCSGFSAGNLRRYSRFKSLRCHIFSFHLF